MFAALGAVPRVVFDFAFDFAFDFEDDRPFAEDFRPLDLLALLRRSAIVPTIPARGAPALPTTVFHPISSVRCPAAFAGVP